MRMTLMAMALGLTVAAITSPAFAASDDERDLGGSEQFLAPADRETPQVNVGIVAGSDAPDTPVVQDRYERN